MQKAFLLAALGTTAACTINPNVATSQDRHKTIYVSAEKVPCVGVAPMTCMQVRERPDQPWTLNYSGIEGFEAVPGTEYKLQITETVIANPPADSSSVSWKLDKILGQRVVER